MSNDPLSGIFRAAKGAWNGADKFFGDKLEEQKNAAKALGTDVKKAIDAHQSGDFESAQQHYVKVMVAVCQAQGPIDGYVDCVMELMEYRLPGEVQRDEIEEILSLPDFLIRKLRFDNFLVKFAAA